MSVSSLDAMLTMSARSRGHLRSGRAEKWWILDRVVQRKWIAYDPSQVKGFRNERFVSNIKYQLFRPIHFGAVEEATRASGENCSAKLISAPIRKICLPNGTVHLLGKTGIATIAYVTSLEVSSPLLNFITYRTPPPDSWKSRHASMASAKETIRETS